MGKARLAAFAAIAGAADGDAAGTPQSGQEFRTAAARMVADAGADAGPAAAGADRDGAVQDCLHAYSEDRWIFGCEGVRAAVWTGEL